MTIQKNVSVGDYSISGDYSFVICNSFYLGNRAFYANFQLVEGHFRTIANGCSTVVWSVVDHFRSFLAVLDIILDHFVYHSF